MGKQTLGTVHFKSNALPEGGVRVRSLRGTDELSRMFEMHVEVEPMDDYQLIEDNLEALLDSPACLVLEGESDSRFWGLIRTIELVEISMNSSPIYRIELVPRVFSASMIERTTIFQSKTVPDILRTVLKSNDFEEHTDFRLDLVGSYPTREYTVQWDETDFHFISRWAEFEGISYYFEHGEDCETVVFVDSNDKMRKAEEHKELRFRSSGVTATLDTFVSTFGRTIRQHTAGVVMIDYNWRNPEVGLQASSPVVGGRLGMKLIADEHFRENAQGKRLAEVRAQEEGTQVLTYRGKTNITTLRAGDHLGLIDHVLPNLDGTYLVTRVTHHVKQVESTGDAFGEDNLAYENEIEAIDVSRTFRPRCVTKRPRIDGLIYATVDGPDTGVAAPIDTEGRYKVILTMDTADMPAGGASRWIRMAQPLAGPSYGMHFPLRVGTEVVLEHIYGDPDRPLIVGAVPNALTPSPVAQANATQSVIQTMTGIRIEFEDSA